MATRTDPTWMIAGAASLVVHAAAGYGLYVAPRIVDDDGGARQLGSGQVITLPPAAPSSQIPANTNASPSQQPSVALPDPLAKPAAPRPTAEATAIAAKPQVDPPETEMVKLGTDNGQAGVKRWLEANAEGVHVAIPGPDDQAGLTRRSGAVGAQPGQPGPVGTRGQSGEAGQGGQQGQAGSGGAAAQPEPMPDPAQPDAQPPAQPTATNSGAARPNAAVPLPPAPRPAASAPAPTSKPVTAGATGPLAMPVDAQANPPAEEQFTAATKDQAKSPLPVGPDRPGSMSPAQMQDPKLPGEGQPLPPETKTDPAAKAMETATPAPGQREETANTPPEPERPASPSDAKPSETSFGPLDLLLSDQSQDGSKRSDALTPPLVLLPSVFDAAMKRMAESRSRTSQPSKQAEAQAGGGAPGAAGNPGKPGIPGDPGDPAAADAGEPGLQSDRESDAFSTKTGEYRAGRVIAGQGIEIRPTRPKFGLLARTLALPAPPRVEVVFGRDGTVKRARVVRSSGYVTEIDEPIINAVYEWTATGKALADLPPDPTAEMRLNLTVYLR